MLKLRVFGGLTLTSTAGPTPPRASQRRRLALLAVLAVAKGRPLSRDKLVALLWPEADTESARHLLADSIYVLRGALGADALITSGDDVSLNPECIESDVMEFGRALDEGDRARAATVYGEGGVFLDGIHLNDAPEFERWIDSVRSQLGADYRRALEALANDASRLGNNGDAVAWWRRLAAEDRLSSRIALELMRALVAAGDVAGALEFARAHEKIVRVELDAAADPAVMAFADDLRLRGDARVTARSRAPTAAPPSAARTASTATSGTPVATPNIDEALRSALDGRYVVERELGRGGMATVFLARDIQHDRAVALKVLHPDLAAALGAERFLREIQIAARLTHPHILPLHESGAADKTLFYIMPYVEGESVRQRLDRKRQLPLEDAVQIAAEVADALDYAHANGVVHRDIKPENILLVGRHAVIADFGIARAVSASSESNLTATGVALGTAAYMSPEQATGEREVDGRSDIYSLGCVLYEMLAGEPPFTGATLQAVIARRFTTTAQPVRSARPSVPPKLEEVVTRALAVVPADRYQSAREFGDALAVAKAELARGRESATPMGVAAGPRLLTRRVMAYAAGVLVLVGAVYAALQSRHRLVDVAVLPLQDASSDSASGQLADGMTEELSDALTTVGVTLISRTSAFAFKGHRTDPRRIADSLQVANVLTGKVSRTGVSMRLRVELVDATDGSARWSDTFERDMTEVLTVYDSIGRAVAAVLKIKRPRAVPRLVRQTNPAAYDLFLRGRAQRELRNDTAFAAAIEYFKQAIAADSGYAAAYAGLSEASFLRGYYSEGLGRSRQDFYAIARAAALKAVALDSMLPDGHMALGVLSINSHIDLAIAGAELKRALALDPGHRRTHEYLSSFYGLTGRPAEALAEARRAVLLDPLSVTALREVGTALFRARRYDEALAQLERARTLGPPLRAAPLIIAQVYAMKNMFPQAIAELRRNDLSARLMLGYMLARSGQQAEARRILADFIERSRNGSSAYAAAVVYAGLRDFDQAFTWLDKSFDDESLRLQIMEPTFDELRLDPRFERVRKRLGLQKL